MKKLLIAAAVSAACAAPLTVQAQTPAPAAATPDHTVTGNMAIVSDYRFRGISQTGMDPAIQGGIDYSHSSGFYLGNWNSSVTSDSFIDGAGIEMDFYGGFKIPIGEATLDIGGLYYFYPDAEIVDGEKYDTFEAYVGLSYGPISGKIWYAVTDWFGVTEDSGYEDDTDGSIYYEVNGTFPLADQWSLVAHVGYQDVKGNNGDLDYMDWKLGVVYDWSGWMLGAAVVGSDADDDFYFVDNNDATGDTTVVLSVSKTF
ncbi:MAG TPA: TorF family putative porin [Burkholderiales bacterium]|jgi:uncharacterized protein (TIGR02001 family)|nr:TorF family putative porin [Burkholderiales bacterium]